MKKQKKSLTTKIMVTLYIDAKIYDTFRSFCEKEGLKMSRKVEDFMKGFVK